MELMAGIEPATSRLRIEGTANCATLAKLGEYMLTIAIDGPAGTGKTTIARLLSKKLDILYLNTGNLYRAVALFFYRKYGEFDENIVKKEINQVNIDIEYVNGEQVTLLNGEEVDAFLRDEKISMIASIISSYVSVREKLLKIQRLTAKNQNVIVDGRDIGTIVLPNADVKIFLTASSEIRARRRAEELREKGILIDEKELKKDIENRDYNDSHRNIAPLKQAHDAINIDTSNLTIDQVLQKCLDLIKYKVRH